MALYSFFGQVKQFYLFVQFVLVLMLRLKLKPVCLQDNGSTWCVLELQSAAAEEGRRYRVARYWQDDVAAKV